MLFTAILFLSTSTTQPTAQQPNQSIPPSSIASVHYELSDVWSSGQRTLDLDLANNGNFAISRTERTCIAPGCPTTTATKSVNRLPTNPELASLKGLLTALSTSSKGSQTFKGDGSDCTNEKIQITDSKGTVTILLFSCVPTLTKPVSDLLEDLRTLSGI